jgi:glycerol-3-phosphate dehydrogenase (NAD(P)+)
MDSKNTSEYKLGTVGVLGSGSFGTAMANILAENNNVLLYTRRDDVIENIRKNGTNFGQKMNEKVRVTKDLKEVAENCKLIYPILSSSGFREVMKSIAPYLTPGHVMIHGTKGLDTSLASNEIDIEDFAGSRNYIFTMSNVILQETPIKRVGVIAGPNLAGEIAQGLPAASVIASNYDEVINIGIQSLKNHRFKVYPSHDLIGTELSGILKNPIAIAAGIHTGLELGENARAFLITRGLSEMIKIGKVLGSDTSGFFGLAGVGDLIATCSSKLSRNFTIGFKIANGEKLDDVVNSMNEVAEGINTVKIACAVSKFYGIRTPILNTLYAVLFENLNPNDGLEILMKSETVDDVDFI